MRGWQEELCFRSLLNIGMFKCINAQVASNMLFSGYSETIKVLFQRLSLFPAFPLSCSLPSSHHDSVLSQRTGPHEEVCVVG